MTAGVNGSGYNAVYGLLGSNKATEDKVKLFPPLGGHLALQIGILLADGSRNGIPQLGPRKMSKVIVRQVLELQLVGRSLQAGGVG